MIKLESRLGDAVFVTGIESDSFKTSKEWADTTHFHVDFELHIILSGNATLEIDGEDAEVGAGDICLLAPGTGHYPKSFTDALEKTNFYFSLAKNYDHPRGVREFSEYDHYGSVFKPIKKYLIIHDAELVSVIKKLLSVDLSRQSEHIFSANLSLFYITLASRINEHLLLENNQPLRQNEGNEALFRQRKIVEEFFQKRYNEEVGIDDLARELCLSTSHTHRIVKKVFREGFKQTLMKQRIEHACMLIKQGELSLTEIAYRCGYTSYNGFLSAFKNHVGRSPKEYEKSII